MHTRTYRYRQLKGLHSIRLLRFLPDSNSEDIRCTIDEYDTEAKHIPYAALSYVWGDARVRHAITIDGKTAYVTSNLKEALAHLAGEFSEWSFWIDAICIDQDNTEEKINADGVVMWLDPGNEEIERLKLVIESHYKHCPFLHESIESCKLFIDAGLVAAMQHLVQHPYWYRVWIIQEIVVSKSTILMCGTTMLHWPHLSQFLGLVHFGHFTLPHRLRVKQDGPGGQTFHIHRLYSMSRTSLDLANALVFSFSSFATDSRDEIYALLGLLNTGAGRLISPDYTLSPCNVYCLAIRAMLWHGRIDSIPLACLDDTFRRERAPGGKKAGRLRRSSNRFPFKGFRSPVKKKVPTDTGCNGIECGTRFNMRHVAMWHNYPELTPSTPIISQPPVDLPSPSGIMDTVRIAHWHKFFTEYNTTSLIKQCDDIETKRPFYNGTAKHMVLAGLYLGLHPVQT
ncbi:heterokaryon incompatibility protein-domain-containing protein [Alternaria rosae]|uniref:heterokaryon incompatibility protein-domain-containing protein n=1 Tax=Alternaria rosae TaxID=1187941 RepID=UPI001E8E2615|nr:heterokaryon incompatibility protein-domain-containing protein [Alternaria rosae]KAH6868557.1 heterokaryon incompatibility protein-domain-containing protein [Alternaria rosae]